MGGGVYPGRALWDHPKFKVIHPDSGTSVPSPGVKPRSPASKVDSLLSEPPGKHINTGVGSLFPSPGDLPNPGIEPGGPTVQVDSLLAELPGKPQFCIIMF